METTFNDKQWVNENLKTKELTKIPLFYVPIPVGQLILWSHTNGEVTRYLFLESSL